jgi:hypothetical protein
MGWVLKSWRTEALTALAGAEAQERARKVVLHAQRQARLMGRVAAREASDAIAYLEALEQFGIQTRLRVREQRRTLRAVPSPAAPPEAPPARPHEGEQRLRPKAKGGGRSRPGRATLRDSPLTELFRATKPE